MKKFLLIITCAMLVSGCATGSFVSSSPKAKNDTSTTIMQCYYFPEKPDKAYDVIGHVEASGFVFSSNKQLVYALQKQARQQQADAIINVRFSYIPALLIGIPYAEGDLIKYR
ncbi:MAG: hypothetical protein K6F29_03260 [Bacteroidales bacterium]|jgi:hypothetical protein|nr:hypothetical protein [Bacteroidales bacterium]MCR5554531.1 hypothetical protein [Bacteroidales bacterium]